MANSGMLVPNEAISLSQCTDGASNTIMVGEESGPVHNLVECPGGDCRDGEYGGWGGHSYWQGDAAPITPLSGPISTWASFCNLGPFNIECPCSNCPYTGAGSYHIFNGGGTTVVVVRTMGRGMQRCLPSTFTPMAWAATT